MHNMTQFQLLDVDHLSTRDKTVVRLFGIDEKGTTIKVPVHNFQPYFYVDPIDLNYVTDMIGLWGLEYEIVDRFRPIGRQTTPTEMIKVYAKKPADVPALRDKLKKHRLVSDVYEADILFKNRWMIDNGIHGMQWLQYDKGEVEPLSISKNAPLRYLSWDIEVLPPEDGTFPKAEKDPIILISLAFNKEYRGSTTLVLTSDFGERQLIEDFVGVINEYDPDIVTGYNINGFDFPYVMGRCNQLDIALPLGRDGSSTRVGERFTSILGRVVVDLLPIVRSSFSLRRYNLDTVSKELLDTPKLDLPAKEMRELWINGGEAGRERFMAYAERDAVLVLDLISKYRLVDRYIALSQRSGVLLQDAINGGQSVKIDNMLYRAFRAEDRVVPCRPDDDELRKREKEIELTGGVKGAVVLDPVRGLHEDVTVLDYQSLYPSIMMSHNICFSTILDEQKDDCIDAAGYGYYVTHEEYEGIIPRVLRGLFEERVAIKKSLKGIEDEGERNYADARQYALKILLNSFYGYTGFVHSRLYDIRVANSITGVGRNTITSSVEIVKTNNPIKVNGYTCHNDVIYGDTDSLLYKTMVKDEHGVAIPVTRALSEEIGKVIADLATRPLPPPMKLVYEDYFKRTLLMAKKRYIMGREDGSKKIKGIETVRRDFCPLTSTTLSAVLDIIIDEGDVAKALSFTKGVVADLRGGKDIPIEDLILTRNLSRPISEYKNTTMAHLGAIQKLERAGLASPVVGDRIAYIISPRGKLLKNKAVPIELYGNDGQYDRDYYLNRQLLPPLLRVFDALGIDEREVKADRRQMSLEDW